MTNVVVFFHDDADGHCAGASYKYLTEQSSNEHQMKLVPIKYGYDTSWLKLQVFTDSGTVDKVVFVDFCPRKEDFMDLHSYVDVCVFDHHKSSEWVKEFDTRDSGNDFKTEVNHDNNKAGCEIVWDVLKALDTTPVPPSVWMVGRYDVWDHCDERIVPFVTGLRLLITDPSTEDGYEFWKASFETLDCLDNNASPEQKAERMRWDVVLQVLNMGHIALMYRAGLAEEKTKMIHDMKIGDKMFQMVNSNLFDDYDFPADEVDEDKYFGYGWYYWDGKAWKFSLRSTGDHDLTTIEGVQGRPSSAWFKSKDFNIPLVYMDIERGDS